MLKYLNVQDMRVDCILSATTIKFDRSAVYILESSEVVRKMYLPLTANETV